MPILEGWKPTVLTLSGCNVDFGLPCDNRVGIVC
jgi:hypothetical protein